MNKKEKAVQKALGTLSKYTLDVIYYIRPFSERRISSTLAYRVPHILRHLTFSCHAPTKTEAIRNLRAQRISKIGKSRKGIHRYYYRKDGVVISWA